MSYNNIPREMREYRQWVLWRYENDGSAKPTKVPYSAASGTFGQHAAVDNPHTWASFDETLSALEQPNNSFSGMGFVLTEHDPFVFVDLDDSKGDAEKHARQVKVWETFKTYSEYSPSGNGLHLIGYGAVPQGRKRSAIEIYSRLRFMTMTGRVYSNVPIRDVNDLALTLWGQMGADKGKGFYDPKAPQTMTDEAVMDMAANAENSVKFLDLWNGNWQNYYQSQSEADLALFNILAFFTQNREQIIRLFRNSALGQRKKAHRNGYMEYNINKAFDQILPPVDIEGLAEGIHAILAKKNGPGANQSSTGPEYSVETPNHTREETRQGNANQAAQEPSSLSDAILSNDKSGRKRPLHLEMPPPGLMGQIADFIYKQAPRQVPEIALVAAIGMMAGICGRSYNVSGTGLNQYLMLLGNTGVGKEGMASGMDKLIRELSMQIPRIDEFFGAGGIASGQALRKQLSETNCFVSVVGEVDSMIKQLSQNNANGAQLELKRVLLDLYNKSGAGRMLRGTIYSDTEKNVGNVERPSFSMLGEATPQLLFKSLDEELITSGFLPRWTIIEYTGGRPNLNKNAANVKPSKELIDNLATLAEHSIRMNGNNVVIDIEASPDAQDLLDRFNELVDDRMRSDKENVVVNQLWNRAHIKALKLSALIAVGLNPYEPRIDVISANYAIELVKHDINNILKRFSDGTIGIQNDEVPQRMDMLRVIHQFLTTSFDKLAGYGVVRKHYDHKAIPYAYLNRRLASMASFRKDRNGPTAALKRMTSILMDEGVLLELNKNQCQIEYGNTAKVYAIQNIDYIMQKLGK